VTSPARFPSREHSSIRSIVRYGATAGVFGAILLLIGVLIEPRQALTSYLFAFVTVLGIVLGALLVIMMSYLTAAHWFVPLRQVTLAITGALPALAVLLLPVLVGVGVIYPWASPAQLAPDVQVVVARKAAWLNVPFFVVRGIVYVVLWLVIGELFRRWSFAPERDTQATIAKARRLRRLSALGAIVVGLTFTFASFDWTMSLEPAWYSTIYGAYVFAGGFLAALALIAVLAWALSRPGAPLHGVLEPDHVGALGKLLLTFVIFWAYIGYSQYLIIWIGDLPSEVTWYASRARGGWGVLALVMLLLQFALPFLLLLSWSLKRRAGAMAIIGAILLLAHLVDSYWLVLPALHPTGVRPSWLDVAALLTVVGFSAAAAAWRARPDLFPDRHAKS